MNYFKIGFACLLLCSLSLSSVSCACRHTYVETEVAATCTEEGYNLFTCDKCEDSYRGDKIIPKTNHTYIKTEVAATCAEAGYTLSTCDQCGDSYKDNNTPKLNHKGVAECTVCGEDIVALWEDFVYQQDGSDHVNPDPIVVGNTTLSISYGVSEKYDCIMSSNKVNGSYMESLLLGYNAYDGRWEWCYICSLGSIEISAGGKFAKWSSQSNTLPCSYSDFSYNILSDVKFLYNTLVNLINAELVEDEYNFTLENLGLGQ